MYIVKSHAFTNQRMLNVIYVIHPLKSVMNQLWDIRVEWWHMPYIYITVFIECRRDNGTAMLIEERWNVRSPAKEGHTKWCFGYNHIEKNLTGITLWIIAFIYSYTISITNGIKIAIESCIRQYIRFGTWVMFKLFRSISNKPNAAQLNIMMDMVWRPKVVIICPQTLSLDILLDTLHIRKMPQNVLIAYWPKLLQSVCWMIVPV